jgi:hypothetical protein
MHKLFSIMIPMGLLVGSAFAANGLKGDGKFGTAGCGLGSMVFADQKGPIQILAATTNDAIFPQTSAISTGTSNCFEDGVALKEKEQEFFANANFESLHQEIAQGQGENLKAFAYLFGCQGDAVELFSSAAHTSYGSIFPSAKTNSTDMLANIHTMVKSRPELQTSCSDRG